MKYLPATFMLSAAEFEQCPTHEKPEFAFVGRSNVGKSSLINMLVGGRDAIAKVSRKPGKTQLINFFDIAQKWCLVDLPGYGYAKTSKAARDTFQEIVSDYLVNRDQLKCVFQLIDSKIPTQEIDLAFSKWLMECEIPFVLVFTKSDRSKKNAINQNIENYHLSMSDFAEGLPRTFISSAKKADGRTQILQFIDNALT